MFLHLSICIIFISIILSVLFCYTYHCIIVVNCSNSDAIIDDCFIRASTQPQDRISKRTGRSVLGAGLLSLK